MHFRRATSLYTLHLLPQIYMLKLTGICGSLTLFLRISGMDMKKLMLLSGLIEFIVLIHFREIENVNQNEYVN